MADEKKPVIPGRVQKISNRNFKIKKDKSSEFDIDIELPDDEDYLVEKLSTDTLRASMPDGNPITWFNNFSIKQNGLPIKKKYKVTIPGISNMGTSRLVICGSSGVPYYFDGAIQNDTFELSDGDPASGRAP